MIMRSVQIFEVGILLGTAQVPAANPQTDRGEENNLLGEGNNLSEFA